MTKSEKVVDGEQIVELFGLQIKTNANVPANTIIIITPLKKEQTDKCKTVEDLIMLLLEKERVYILNMIEKVVRGYKSKSNGNEQERR